MPDVVIVPPLKPVPDVILVTVPEPPPPPVDHVPTPDASDFNT